MIVFLPERVTWLCNAPVPAKKLGDKGNKAESNASGTRIKFGNVIAMVDPEQLMLTLKRGHVR